AEAARGRGAGLGPPRHAAGPRAPRSDGVLAARARPGRADLGEALRADAGDARALDPVETVPRSVDRGLVEGARSDDGHRAVREDDGAVPRSVPRRAQSHEEGRRPAGRGGPPGAQSALAEPGDRAGQADRRARGEERAARGHDHCGDPAPRRQEAAMIGKTIAELHPGDRAEMARVVEEDDIASFIDAVGDLNPVHTDVHYAATTPFKSPIAPGIFTAGSKPAGGGTRRRGLGAAEPPPRRTIVEQPPRGGPAT